MKEYPLKLTDIVTWYRSRQAVLAGSGVSLSDIQERDTGPKPGAFADFDGAETTGRITGWVSGEFDFEANRSDGNDIFSRHIDAVELGQLEDTFAEFIRVLAGGTGN